MAGPWSNPNGVESDWAVAASLAGSPNLQTPLTSQGEAVVLQANANG